jgi:hypothetical protein
MQVTSPYQLPLFAVREENEQLPQVCQLLEEITKDLVSQYNSKTRMQFINRTFTWRAEKDYFQNGKLVCKKADTIFHFLMRQAKLARIEARFPSYLTYLAISFNLIKGALENYNQGGDYCLLKRDENNLMFWQILEDDISLQDLFRSYVYSGIDYLHQTKFSENRFTQNVNGVAIIDPAAAPISSTNEETRRSREGFFNFDAGLVEYGAQPNRQSQALRPGCSLVEHSPPPQTDSDKEFFLNSPHSNPDAELFTTVLDELYREEDNFANPRDDLNAPIL